MHRIRYAMTFGLAAIGTGVAAAQSDIDPAHKFAWSERGGWINFIPGRPNAGDGVQVRASYLSGYAWSEQAGWINLGDGSPTNGINYANVNNTDYGVNRDTGTNQLSGYAWGENIGWINFSGGALAAPRNPAHVDTATCRLRGYAWAENAGWLNLDDASIFVGIESDVCNPPPCVGDLTGDRKVDLSDLAILLGNYGATHVPPEKGDLNGDGVVDLADLASMLSHYGDVCP